MANHNQFDVIIVGGSYAGLSAGMSLGRALRNVLIIDSGKLCNAQTPHSHNFITHDGDTPAAIAAAAKAQVLAYSTVKWKDDLVTNATGSDNDFTIQTASGEQFQSRKIIFATGVKDLMPAIPGHAACWGISVIHCPFCHGYEYKDKQTGIISNNEMTLDFAKLISNWTRDLTVFTNGPIAFDEHTGTELGRIGIPVNEKTFSKIEHEAGYIKQLVFEDGTSQSLDALYSRPAFEQHCTLPAQLGCALTEYGHIQVDFGQKTSVEGIYAAGDCTTMMRAVSAAVAAGGTAGARLTHELISQRYS